MSTPTPTPTPTADESIGRPEEWREGRYQEAGESVDKTVLTPKKTTLEPADIKSTPVTRKDYESLRKPPASD